MVDNVSVGEQSEGVKELKDGVARLVNHHDHDATIAFTQPAGQELICTLTLKSLLYTTSSICMSSLWLRCYDIDVDVTVYTMVVLFIYIIISLCSDTHTRNSN